MLLQPCQGNQPIAPAATLELKNDGNEPCEVISKKDGVVYRLEGNQTIAIPLQKNLLHAAKLEFTVKKGGRAFTVYGVVRGQETDGIMSRRNSLDNGNLDARPATGYGATGDENKHPGGVRRLSLQGERRKSNSGLAVMELDPLVNSTENLINDRLGNKDNQTTASNPVDGSSTPKTPHAQLSALQREAAKRSKVIFIKKEIAPVMLNVYDRLKEGVLKVKTEPSLYHDVGLREKLWEVLEQYHPAWLNEGLLAINPATLSTDREDSEAKHIVDGKKRSLKQRVFEEIFSNQDIIDEQKEKRQGVFPENVDFVIKMSRHVVYRFLELVLFLDRAKQIELLKTPLSCLFKLDAQSKSSEHLLVQFGVIVFAGEGDILRHLRKLDYLVSHKQSALDEYETKIPKGELHTKLRDGVILALLARSYNPNIDVLSQMRIPAKERLHCLMNNEKLLDVLENVDPALLDTGRKGKITKYDLADCNKEKTLGFVWKMVLKFGLKSLIDQNVLSDEIRKVSYRNKSNQAWKKTIESLATDEERGELGFQNLFSDEDDEQQRIRRLLLHWVQVVCASYERVPKVKNFSASIADGSALCVLIHYYHASLVSLENVFFPEQMASEGERLRKERKNFAVVNQAVDALGEVPIRLNSCNSKNPPAQQLAFACVAFLCSRLLGTSTETQAAKKIQTVWMTVRAKKMRTVESEKRARKMILNRALSKYEEVMAARDTGAIIFKDHLLSPSPKKSVSLDLPASEIALSVVEEQKASAVVAASPAESAVERARMQLEQVQEEKRRQSSAFQEELRRERASRKAAQEVTQAELKRKKLEEEKARKDEEMQRRLREDEQAKQLKAERDRRARELSMEAERQEKILNEERQAHEEAEKKARVAALKLEESKMFEAALRDRLARLEAEKDAAEKAALRERHEREEAEKRIAKEKQERDALEREAAETRRQMELELIRERGATAEQFALEQAKWLELTKRNSELLRSLEEAEIRQNELATTLRMREIEEEQHRIELEHQLASEEAERVRLEQEILLERSRLKALEEEKHRMEFEAREAAEQVVRLEEEFRSLSLDREEQYREMEEKRQEELRLLVQEREDHVREEQRLREEQERLRTEQERIEHLQEEHRLLREQDEKIAIERESRLEQMMEDQRRVMEEEDRVLREKIEARRREEEKLEETRNWAEKELRELEMARQREEARIQEVKRRALDEEAKRTEEERKLQELLRLNEHIRQEEARKLDQLREQIQQQERENARRAGVMQKIDEAKRFIEQQQRQETRRTSVTSIPSDPTQPSGLTNDRLQLRGPVMRTPRDHRRVPVGILKQSSLGHLQTPAFEPDVEAQKLAKLVSWLQQPKYFSRIEEILLHDSHAREIILQRECMKAIVWSLRKVTRTENWELRCLLRSLAGVFQGRQEVPASDMNIHVAASLIDILQTFYDRPEEFSLALKVLGVFWNDFRDEFEYRIKTLVDLLDTKTRIQHLCGVRDSSCEQNLERLLKFSQQ